MRKILTGSLVVAGVLAWGLGAQALAPAPSVWLNWALTPAQIQQECEESKKGAQTRFKYIAQQNPGQMNFRNTVYLFDLAVADMSDRVSGPTFLKYVSTDKAVRDAAHECETLIQQFGVEIYTREDIYNALKAYEDKKEPLEGEDKKLLEKTLIEFKRNGLDLAGPKRAEVKTLKQEVVDLELTFGKNLNEWKDQVHFTREDLEGLPEDFVAHLATAPGGKFIVTLDYPDYFPFMENAKSEDARRRLEFKFENRGYPQNIELFEKAIAKRHRAARLLGYKTHADYVLEDRMARNPKAVKGFLDRLTKKLKVKAEQDLKIMEGIKGGPMMAWDWRYFDNLIKKTRHELDSQKVKEYFPADAVTVEMLNIYQELLGVAFKEEPSLGRWHPDAKLYAVIGVDNAQVLGYFYLDLFPREGKFKHAAAFDLVRGRLLDDQTYQSPVAAMVANFNKPSADRPSLLTHSEVETFFHEFGHIMHQVLTRAKYARFSGTNVARDFVEAPSQMLENWVWNKEVLRRLSGHYADRTKKLPDELIATMIALKNLNSGVKYLRQVFFASVDLAYHTKKKVDTTDVWADLRESVALIPATPGTHGPAGFGHLMGGYDAGYYGYLWSEVYSADMFSRFEKEGIMSPGLGREYRRLILEPGRSLDEADQIKKFLGREPNEEAFLKSIGLE